MTVRELIEQLSHVEPDRIVVMSKDGEGNGYSPLADFWKGTYWAETTWYGEVREEQPPEECQALGYDGDDARDWKRAIILQPVN